MMFHFVIPDIVIYTYAANLKVHITELIELIVFHKVILWHYLSTLAFDKHYKIIKDDGSTRSIPINFGLLLIDNSVGIIAKLSDIKYNDNVIHRYLVNGIIMLPPEKNGVERDVKVFRGKNKQKITRPFKVPAKSGNSFVILPTRR